MVIRMEQKMESRVIRRLAISPLCISENRTRLSHADLHAGKLPEKIIT
jgi:hypothetical protein